MERQGHCLKDVICLCLRDDPEKRPTAKQVYNIMSKVNNENAPKRMTKVSSLCSQSDIYFHDVLPQPSTFSRIGSCNLGSNFWGRGLCSVPRVYSHTR